MKNEEWELRFSLVKSEKWRVNSEESRWRSWEACNQQDNKTTKQPDNIILSE